MKKTFTILIAAIAAILMMAQPMKAMGQTKTEQTVTWTASAANNFGPLITTVDSSNTGTITTGSYSWDYTNTLTYLKSGKSDYQDWSANIQYFVQIGSGNAKHRLELSTSAIPGTIKSISIECSSASGGHKLSVIVGSTKYIDNQSTPSGAPTSGNDYTMTGTGTASGAINITFAPGNGAMYIKTITVVYETGGGTTTNPTITFNNGSVNVGKTLDLSTKFTSNSSGAVTYSITTGDSYATLSGSILTGVAEGSVTVKASQAEAGSYNAGEATATITVNAAPTLSSITITTPPTKTTYTEGETFDATGMVVTATYSDATTDDVTASCTFTPSGALTTSDDEITVSYTEGGVTKTATQAITVNVYVQPTEFDIDLNDTFFGTNYGGTASGITDENPASASKDNVTVTYAGSGNHYINASQIRFYPNNKLTFEAPTGYNITKIVFTADGTWAATISANSGTYTASTKTWEGEASSVLFTGSGSSRCDISKVAVTLALPKVLSSISLSGTYPTSFHVDDVFSHEGMTVTANYEDESTKDVTADATFSGYDMSTAGNQTVTVSYGGKTATYGITVNVPATLESITLSGTYPTVFDKGDAFSHEGMTVTAHYNDETSTIVTGEATFSGYDMSTEGEYTVTVSYGGKSATYSITVLETGTESNPYTVAQALENTPSSGYSENVYIHGIVSRFQSNSGITGDGSNYRYYISDDGSTTTDELLVYKGTGLNGATFTNVNDLLVGDIVTIYGKLYKYSNTTKEIYSGNYIVSKVRPGTGTKPTTIAGTVVDFTIANNESYAVESGQILTVTGTFTNNGTAANLIIADGGQLILPDDASVAATVQKEVDAASQSKDYIAPFGWYSISSSVNNAIIAGEGANTNLITASGYDLYRYNETVSAKQWENYHASNTEPFTNMTNGRGYLYRNANSVTIEFTGTVNTGEVEYTVTKSDVGTLSGFNLIGNPYTHDIYKGTGGAIVNSVENGYELATGYYVATHSGAWEAKADNTDPIVKNQGILVQAVKAGTITMTNTLNGYISPSAKANHDNIKFMVSNSQYEDVAYAMFDKGNGLNKISHRNAEIPMLYIPQNDENYAIAMMSDDTQSFGLNFKAMTMGKYTLSYKADGQFSYLHVIDRLTGEDVDMLLEESYSFVGTPKDAENRFIVKLNYQSGLDSSDNSTFAYQSGNDIIVSGEGTLQIFDVMGRMIATQNINGVETVNVPANGVYVFRLNEKVQKVVVK